MSDKSSTGLIEVRHLGLVPYAACLDIQHQIHREVLENPGRGVILTVEHTPVITLGKNADQSFLLSSRDWLKSHGIDLVETDRGGEVTAHEPGQLVVYPILRLADYQLSPKKYVALLENVVIQTLATLGIQGAVHPERPGVWVGANKICALGVRIKDRVSMHGIALNISNLLQTFACIVPCGLVGKGVTSVMREAQGDCPPFEMLRDELVGSLALRLHQGALRS